MENKETKEEVSFLDLLLVLIRYRNLIIIGTLISIILSLGLFYVRPKFNAKNCVLEKAGSVVNITCQVNIQEFPFMVQNRIFVDSNSKKNPVSITVEDTAVKFLRKPSIVAQANKESELFVNKDDEDYLNKIRQVVECDVYDISSNSSENLIEINLIVPEEKKEAAKKFVDSLLALVEKEVEKFYSDQLDMYELSVKSFLEKADKNRDFSNFAENERMILATETSFRNNLKSYLSLSEQPFVTVEEQDDASDYPLISKKKIIFTIFCGFILFVIIAFIKNGIDNVKENQSQKQLVADAWKSGKWRNKK
ncbi:MAG: hypothetical protein K5866_10715 [Treponema sp.]|nr:hypothetical protein [Treponema sp.]